jgi:hypothetical protein
MGRKPVALCQPIVPHLIRGSIIAQLIEKAAECAVWKTPHPKLDTALQHLGSSSMPLTDQKTSNFVAAAE